MTPFLIYTLHYEALNNFPGILVCGLVEIKVVLTFYVKQFSCNPFRTVYLAHQAVVYFTHYSYYYARIKTGSGGKFYHPRPLCLEVLKCGKTKKIKKFYVYLQFDNFLSFSITRIIIME